MFMSDRILEINTLIYNYQIEVNYWNNYYSSLKDYLIYNTQYLNKNQVEKIHNELIDVKLEIKKHQRQICKKLKKTHYWHSEKYYNEILKK